MNGLKVTGLSKRFGGVQALQGVSFEVSPGECVALIGPNGAGKSTCFACLAGQQPPDAGHVSWRGQEVTGLAAAQLHTRGINRTFQVAQVFEALTVLQNLQLTSYIPQGLSAYLPLQHQAREASQALLEQLGLQAVANESALKLPYGLKKRLELGIALASRPQLLLLDEPAAGLAQEERQALMQLVQSLSRGAQPIAVLYTEHNMDAVFGVADRVLVLIDGQIAAQGSPAQVAQDANVKARYLGHSLDAWQAKDASRAKEASHA